MDELDAAILTGRRIATMVAVFAWSSQVNAAVIGVGGLIFVTLLTLWGVRLQLANARTLARDERSGAASRQAQDRQHDADQRRLDRIADRQGRLVDRRVEAAADFDDRVLNVLRFIAPLLEGEPEEVQSSSAAQTEWRAEFDDRRRSAQHAYARVALLFGAFTPTGKAGVAALQELSDSWGPINKLFGAWSQHHFALGSDKHQGQPRTDAGERVAERLEELQQQLYELDIAVASFDEAARAAVEAETRQAEEQTPG